MTETRLILADDRTVTPADLGAPPALHSERGWLAVLGVSEAGVPGLARCGARVGVVLSEVVLPALRLPLARTMERVALNLSPTGFSIGENVLLRAAEATWSQVEAEEAAHARAVTRNAMRARHGRPTTHAPSRQIGALVEGFPRVPSLPDDWELWCGLQSSLGHFCVAMPASVEVLAERIAIVCEREGLACARLRSASELPVW